MWNNGPSNTTIEEVIMFEEGAQFKNLIQNVSQSLGFLYDISKGKLDSSETKKRSSIFHSFYRRLVSFFRINSNDVQYVPLRKGLDSDETFSLVCRFQQRRTSCARVSRRSLLLLQGRIWT